MAKLTAPPIEEIEARYYEALTTHFAPVETFAPNTIALFRGLSQVMAEREHALWLEAIRQLESA